MTIGALLLAGLILAGQEVQGFVPEDGFHPGSKMEMWNVHGHLVTPDGRPLGITTMFFTGKYLIVSGTAVGLGLTDEREKKSAFDYDFFLPVFGKVLHTPGQLGEEYGPNRFRRISMEEYEMAVRTETLSANLRIRPTRPLLPYAGTGLVKWETHESRGYSYPRAEVAGTVVWKGVTYPVTGHVNVDHAWSDAMEEDHDLFMIQLEDGTDANILFRHDRKGKGPLPGSFVSIAFPDGRRVSYESFTLDIEGKWKSPKTGRAYPNHVSVRVPDEFIVWELVPSFDEQEFAMMMNMMAFWAGTGSVKGIQAGRPTNGRYCGMQQGYGKE